jgi:hypothetical protein
MKARRFFFASLSVQKMITEIRPAMNRIAV